MLNQMIATVILAICSLDMGRSLSQDIHSCTYALPSTIPMAFSQAWS